MSALVADTHAVVWYLLGSANLSPTARTAIDSTIRSGDPVSVPSVCLVELVYLVEKGRLPDVVLERLSDILLDPDTGFVLAPLDLGVSRAVQQVPRAALPDMPDRIIAATALHLGLPLVTRDRRIRAAGIVTIW